MFGGVGPTTTAGPGMRRFSEVTDGLTLQAGVSTGRTSENNCEIIAALPEMANLTAGNAAPVGGVARIVQMTESQPVRISRRAVRRLRSERMELRSAAGRAVM